ncbi:MAG TPA: branched-chain amino acid ABC transporter permease, partial [Elusimicrobiota bacterium]|nr:branched-chain amino acid ABC transporter permease [Elusimicrobiota bacterium]
MSPLSTTIAEQLLNGLTLCGIYALIALGYTMVYGVLQMINFAHSELFMWGGVAGALFLSFLPADAGGGALIAAFVVAMGASGILAMILDRVAYAPVRRSSRLTPLISAIGASLFLQNLVFLWRDSQMAFPQPLAVRSFP